MISLRKAINANCKSCSYDELDRGTWRWQVEHCQVTTCDLYEVRPKTLAKKANSEDKTSKQGDGQGVGL